MFSAFLRKKSLHDDQIVVVWKAEREKSLLEGPKASEAAVCICEWFYGTTQWQKAVLSPMLKNKIQECLLYKKFSINKYLFENI